MSIIKWAQHLMATFSDFSELWVLRVIRKGLIYSMPLILIGSMVILLMDLPIAYFQEFMQNVAGAHWRTLLESVKYGTLDIISVTVLIGICYAIIGEYNTIRKSVFITSTTIAVILGCYLLFVKTGGALPAESLANTGLFTAIVFSVVVTSLFLWFYNHRLFKERTRTFHIDNMMDQMLGMIEPAFFTFLSVALFKLVASVLFPASFSLSLLAAFLKSINDFWATIIFEILTQILWFFGLHGSNLLETVTEGVFNANARINALAIANGGMPSEIFTKQFLDVFVYMGGSGSALCLILAVLIKGRKHSCYRLAKFSLLAAVFNINEVLIFGLPVIFNLFFLIPFVLTPVVLTAATYFAMSAGLVPLTITDTMNWTTPVFLGGFAATGSFGGAVLQLFNLMIGTAIYLPFVTLYEKHKTKLNQTTLAALIHEVMDGSCTLSDRNDEIGNLAVSLANDIRSAIDTGENPFYMEYQPQISYQSAIVGAEALLRWDHALYGMIPPPVIIKIAEEYGLTHRLGNWITETTFKNIEEFRQQGIENIIFSINLIFEQINNKDTVEFIKTAAFKHNVDLHRIEFELTESNALEQTPETMYVINELKKLGAKLAIDDFGMGHSSLLYIKEFHIDSVKLDKVLVEDIDRDISCQEIVSSISNLCGMLRLTLVAEYVETVYQRDRLHCLGCDVFQGYYYSRSLKKEAFTAFVLKK